MSLIPHTFLPRSMFDMDSWFKPPHLSHEPSTLDVFDTFDELDRQMGRNLQWLNKPASLMTTPFKHPKVPQKYRINLDCRGYSPKSIKTEVVDGKLNVSGSEGHKNPSGDYSVREFKKSYALPEEVDVDHMTTFMTSHGHLIIEIPFKNHGLLSNTINEALFPKITEGTDGTKNVSLKLTLPKNIDPAKMHVTCKDHLKLTLPKNIDPAKMHVTCKDHDLIIKGEDKFEKPDGFSQTYYYQRTTLPENTDFNHLKCQYDDTHHLSICAPLSDNMIQGGKQQEAIKQ